MSEYIYTGPDPKIPKNRPIRLPSRALSSDGNHYGAIPTRSNAFLKKMGFALAPDRPAYDVETQRVKWIDGAWAVEDLPEPPTPEPRSISPIEFIGLAQAAGGMTDAQLVASKSDANLAAMWIKFDMAPSLSPETPDVQAGIAGLDALGYLPNGASALLAAWPTEG